MNSKGNIVWDHNENQDFKYRVTAIGRDDLSGLYQSQSSNTYSDFKFTIGVQSSEDNNTDLKNGEFFFWSDNNKSIEIKKPTDSTSVILLERKWKYIHVEPFDKKLQFNFTLNSNVFDSVDLTKYSSALAFYSNISDFKSNNITRLIPMEQRTTDYWQTILALNKDNVQGYFGIALIPNNSDYLPIVKFSCPERQVSIKTPKLMYVDNCKVNNSIGDEILKIDDLKGLNEINLKDLPKGKNILSLFSGEIKVWEKEIYIDYKNCGNTSNYSVSVKAQPSPASVHEIVNFKIIGENIQSNEEYQLYMYSMDGKVVDILRGTLKNGNEVLTKVFQLPGIFKYTLIGKNEIVAEGSVVVN
ncbi:MAG: hypothetical protein IPH93_16605 [Saprospiraceae bacterium]|nr:hypothetical protein [Saprospiraceae bacterium]